jgi:hypothetical protein
MIERLPYIRQTAAGFFASPLSSTDWVLDGGQAQPLFKCMATPFGGIMPVANLRRSKRLH